MKKQSTSTVDSTLEELEITVVTRKDGVTGREVQMKLPSETTFKSIIEFMKEQNLLTSKNVQVRSVYNESHIIGHNRKIIECYNIIKLKFYFEEVTSYKEKLKKMKLEEGDIDVQGVEEINICGREQCSLM